MITLVGRGIKEERRREFSELSQLFRDYLCTVSSDQNKVKVSSSNLGILFKMKVWTKLDQDERRRRGVCIEIGSLGVC